MTNPYWGKWCEDDIDYVAFNEDGSPYIRPKHVSRDPLPLWVDDLTDFDEDGNPVLLVPPEDTTE